jgi:hypothetical protein
MEDELGYWLSCLIEFEQALEGELEMEAPNDETIKLLKFEIMACEEKIDEINNV